MKKKEVRPTFHLMRLFFVQNNYVFVIGSIIW